jgi:GNAT superfamily N-acetyltransferase
MCAAGRLDNQVMTGFPLDATTTTVAPGSLEGRAVLTSYFRDIVSRYYGREATHDEVSAAMTAEPSDDLCPPGGLFLVARQDGAVIGCAGLRLLPAGLGEIKRVFVVPQARRHGIGAQLLRAVEDAARKHAVTRLRLDTRSDLAEARQLYATNGYREVAPFNDGCFADHWYEKSLT